MLLSQFTPPSPFPMCPKSGLSVCVTIAALGSNVPIPGQRFRSTYKWLIVFTLRNNSVGKESTCNAGDPGLISGLGRSGREGIGYPHQYSWASLVAQVVKNWPAMWDTWVQSLGWEDPPEKGMASPLQYSGLENSMGYSMGSQRAGHKWATFTPFKS